MRDKEQDLKDLQELTKLYNKAVGDNRSKFTFRNSEVLTAYAKYLIQYLENELGVSKKDANSIDIVVD